MKKLNKRGFLPIMIIIGFITYTLVFVTVMAAYFAAVDYGQALPGTETYKGSAMSQKFQNTISLISFLRTNSDTEKTTSEAIIELQKAYQDKDEAAFTELSRALDEEATKYTAQYKNRCILIDVTQNSGEESGGKESLLWQHKGPNCRLISARQISDQRLRADAVLPSRDAKTTISVTQRTGEATY